ncbi:MAG: hypothetical protein HDT38_07145 [Clostridiales bacterium]|nr:hypothetical protein [Clostridiales bacterium]
MSASREKKQRKSAGPDQKALKVQQDQAARKRKTIVYSVAGAVAAVLVIALLVWRSGFFQARASAATVGNETLSTAQLSYYYHYARNTVANSYYSSLLGFDGTKSDDEQFYDAANNMTYRDYFMEAALTTAQESFALSEEAKNSGHTTDEIKDTLDAQIAGAKSAARSSGYSYAAYLRALYGPYMTAGVFEQELTRVLMAELVKTEKKFDLYDGYSQAELDAYYAEHGDDLDTIEYSYLYFATSVATKDDDGNDLPEDEVEKLKDEAMAEAKEKAEEALAAVKGGSTFESQADKYELTAANHGDHTKVVGTGNVSSAYRDQLLKLGKDKCELVEGESGYYVISFHDRYLVDEPTYDVRHILVAAETTTDDDGHTVAPTDEAWAAAKAKMDEIQAAWDASDKSEDAFAKLANENSDDGDGTTGGLYERVYEGWAVSEFNDWVFGASHQPGDVGLVQHNEEGGSYYGYHLIYYVKENEPVWMGTVRNTMANTALTEWTDGLTAAYPPAQTNGANYLGK